MDTKNGEYFDWLCRTCMYEVSETTIASDQAERRWKSIYDRAEECGGMPIVELLCNTTPQIEVKHGDDLPKKICHQCLQQLTIAHRFQQMCIQSDREMREIISKNFANLTDSLSDTPSEEDLHFDSIDQVNEVESVSTVLEEQQTGISDPLLNNGAVFEKCRDSQEDVNKCVKNEACVAADEYLAKDNRQIIDSTIDVKEQVVAIATRASLKYICDICNKEFAKSRYLKSHIDRHAASGEAKDSFKHACDICNKKFTKKRYLKNHLKRHTASEEEKDSFKHACAICDKMFAQSRYLKTHLKRHTASVADKDSYKHACVICNKKFAKCRYLKSHLKRHAKEENKKMQAPEQSTEPKWKRHRKKYACEICKKTIIYKSSTEIQNHIRSHTGERPFLCPECGKSFKSAGCMREHRLRHSDVKSYECPYCPARFYCSADIFKHKLTHKAVKKHICDICGQGFSEKCTLTKHKICHTGKRPYKCEYCEMCFVRADHQRRHMLTHTGEKPYKCKYCERAFAQQNDQVKHLRTHLGENVYGCVLCPSAFRSASERRIHFATHKNEDEETRERNLKALKEKEAELQLKFYRNETKLPLAEDPKQQEEA